MQQALETPEFYHGFNHFRLSAVSAKVPHRIFWLSRREDERDFEDQDDFQRHHGLNDVKGILTIPTSYLRRRLAEKMKQFQKVQRIWLQDILSTSNLTRSAAGFIYEYSFILTAQEKLDIQLWPMHCCEKNIWKTHQDTANSCQDCESQAPKTIPFNTGEIKDRVSFKADTNCMDVLPAYSSKKGWTLWIPQASNNRSVDCILVQTARQNRVYYLQCTISRDDDGTPFPDRQRFSGPKWEEHFVFISPHNNISCSELDVGDGVKPYFAQWKGPPSTDMKG